MSIATIPTRADRLQAWSIAFTDTARQLAAQGDLTRAMMRLAVADALAKAARGDSLGRRLALLDAKALRRAARAKREIR